MPAGPASILLTLASKHAANTTLAVSVALQTHLLAQSALTLSLSLTGGDASPLAARCLHTLLRLVPPPASAPLGSCCMPGLAMARNHASRCVNLCQLVSARAKTHGKLGAAVACRCFP